MQKRFGRKFTWMMVTLIAPELLTGWAFMEFLGACFWTRRIKNAGIDTWTIARSFFADMCGFVMRGSRGTIIPLEDILPYLRDGDFLDLPPFLSGEQLMDRSKSDALLKVIAMIQSLYLLIQVVARKYQALPLTELELASTAYVLCTVITYIFWFRWVFTAAPIRN